MQVFAPFDIFTFLQGEEEFKGTCGWLDDMEKCKQEEIMKKIKICIVVLTAALGLSSWLTGCSGGGGGAAGPNSAPGEHSVVAAVRNSAPMSACANGGISVDAGIDVNGNGILDPSEVTSTQYVCNGANGTNGLNALVSVTTEPMGTNCANGGNKVNVGPDTNGNGVLDASEITSTDYICSGTNGTNGTNGSNGTNGANGSNTLVSIVSEPTGSNCANGGSKVTSGLDSNANSILDAGEVTMTTYVCNGATGPAGPGVTWVDVTGTSVQAVSNTGYLADNVSQVTVTLPVSPAVGDIVQVTGIGAGGWKIAQNDGQSIITKDLPGSIGATWTARDSVRNWFGVASSSDGTKLVSTVNGGQIYTSTDSGVTWTARDSARNWFGVASSSDGTKLVAAVNGDQIYTSTDSGVTWTARDSIRNWFGVASSSDGTKLVATVNGGQIYTSTDSGVTWTARDSARNWEFVASSSDGTKLVATVTTNGQIYTSTDSGVTWTARDSARYWFGVASSSDGTKLVAAAYGGQIYTSTDSGVTWTARDSVRNWYVVASSSDGTKLVATVNAYGGGQIYTSTDSGVTWTARDSVRNWYGVASSSDGTKLVAAVYGGQIYTSSLNTTIGTAGSISGGQYDAIELQCIGNNTFTVLSNEGYLTVQ